MTTIEITEGEKKVVIDFDRKVEERILKAEAPIKAPIEPTTTITTPEVTIPEPELKPIKPKPTPSIFKKYGKYWQPEEEQKLRELLEKGVKSKFMPEIIGRTLPAIRKKITDLKLNKEFKRTAKRWTDAERETIIKKVKAGTKYKKIAELLSRPYPSVTQQIIKLKTEGKIGKIPVSKKNDNFVSPVISLFEQGKSAEKISAILEKDEITVQNQINKHLKRKGKEAVEKVSEAIEED